MTRVEALSEVLRDTDRSEGERDQAVAILRDIASTSADTDERLAAERILADLPRPQHEEDRLIELAMDDPRITRDDPRYSERLARLCGDLWVDAYMFAGALAPAEEHVADLISLFGRTASARIKAAIIRSLRQFAEHSSHALARNDARRLPNQPHPRLTPRLSTRSCESSMQPIGPERLTVAT